MSTVLLDQQVIDNNQEIYNRIVQELKGAKSEILAAIVWLSSTGEIDYHDQVFKRCFSTRRES